MPIIEGAMRVLSIEVVACSAAVGGAGDTTIASFDRSSSSSSFGEGGGKDDEERDRYVARYAQTFLPSFVG